MGFISGISFDGSSRGVEEIEFNDGTTLLNADVQEILLAAIISNGNDQVFGYAGVDTISGGLGDDYLSGGGGDDTYTYDLGDGRDHIYEGISQGNNDRLLLGPQIVPSSVTVNYDLQDVNDIILSFHNHGGVRSGYVYLDNFINNSSTGVDKIEFSDGTVWTSTDIVDLFGSAPETSYTIVGTPQVNESGIGWVGGEDNLIGTTGADRIDGLSGADYISGGAGDDYIFRWQRR